MVCEPNQVEVNEPRMKMVRMYSVYDFEKLPTNKFGIKEPRDLKLLDWLYEKEQEPEKYKMPKNRQREVARPEFNDLDLIIVPGLAFTFDGGRLGHGKGYYDEFLEDWFKRSTRPLYSMGVCFRQQLTNETLLREPHDYQIDEIIFAER